MFSINAGAAAGAPGSRVICIGLAEFYRSGRCETVCRTWMKPDVAVALAELPKTGWVMQKAVRSSRGLQVYQPIGTGVVLSVEDWGVNLRFGTPRLHNWGT